MTNEFIPRKKPLPEEQLFPYGARQMEVFAKIKNILKRAGAKEEVAHELALRIWRVTRRQ